MSLISARIDPLLARAMPIEEIASVLERPVKEVILYVANKGVSEDESLSFEQLSRIEGLFFRSVPVPEIASVLKIKEAVIETYQTNRAYLVRKEAESQWTESPNSLDFLRWRFCLKKPLLQTPLEKRRDYQAAPLKLHWAIENGFLELLAKNKGQISKRNLEGYTPLHWAAIHGSKDAVKLLLELGADINEVSEKGGETPVFLAAINDHGDVIKELTKYGADLKQVNLKKKSPLYAAVEQQKIQAATALLETNNSNPYFIRSWDNPKHSVLSLACSTENIEMVKLICRYVTRPGVKEFSYAIKSLDLTKVLLETIERTDQRTGRSTYLSILTQVLGVVVDNRGPGFLGVDGSGETEIAEYLITRGANPCANKKLPDSGETWGVSNLPSAPPLIFHCVLLGKYLLAGVLLNHGAKEQINYTCDLIYTPEGITETAQSLLPSILFNPIRRLQTIRPIGFEPTLLYHAARWGMSSMVKFLAESEAKVDINLGKDNIFNVAVANCGPIALRALCERGVDVNQKSPGGLYSLQVAINADKPKLMPVLMELGFNKEVARGILANEEKRTSKKNALAALRKELSSAEKP